MTRANEIGRTATTIRREGCDTVVRYHQTDVVRFDEQRITLNSGGWRTQTTKLRMNQTARQYRLPYTVFQEDYAWFVKIYLPNDPSPWEGEQVPFTDGMTILYRR